VRHPLLLVYEGDGRLAALLREPAAAAKWSLREARRTEEVLQLLEHGGPAALVLRVGRDLEGEMTLLERVAWLFPDAAAVVVGEAEQAPLAGLAWDLGATYFLSPSELEDLPEIVAALMGGGPVPAEQGGAEE
jgi:DNA-binding NarL/FixJ family response regulator